MSLDTLHFEAGVPHYAAKLQKSMNRFFHNLTPDKPAERNNVRLALFFPIAHLRSNAHSSSSNSTTDCTGPIEWASRWETKLLVRLLSTICLTLNPPTHGIISMGYCK